MVVCVCPPLTRSTLAGAGRRSRRRRRRGWRSQAGRGGAKGREDGVGNRRRDVERRRRRVDVWEGEK